MKLLLENWRQYLNEGQKEDDFKKILDKISQGMSLEYAAVLVIHIGDEQLKNKFHDYLLREKENTEKFITLTRNEIVKEFGLDPLVGSNYNMDPYSEELFIKKEDLKNIKKALIKFTDPPIKGNNKL